MGPGDDCDVAKVPADHHRFVKSQDQRGVFISLEQLVPVILQGDCVSDGIPGGTAELFTRADNKRELKVKCRRRRQIFH